MNEQNIRKNPLCVISKRTFGDCEIRDVQTNTAWTKNPYGDEYAIVPDEMVQDIMSTNGFCDIVLNKEGTEIVSFTARKVPEIPEPVTEPTQLDRIEAQVTYTAMMTDTLIV